MEDLENTSVRDLLNQLPPVDQAPIFDHLGRLGLRKFRDEYAVETPVTEEGIVDHDALVKLVGSFVLDTYKWKAPFFDEHHLHWTRAQYAEHAENPDLALAFRNSPIHKIWTPRQFHDTVHVLTVPSAPPSVEVMRRSVKDFRRKNFLYTIASEAIELHERSQRVRQYESKDEIMYIDPLTRRVTRDEEDYDRRRSNFVHFIERHHRDGLIDLSELSSIDLRDADSIAAALPEIKTFVAPKIVRRKGHAARQINLLIDRTPPEESERAA